MVRSLQCLSCGSPAGFVSRSGAACTGFCHQSGKEARSCTSSRMPLHGFRWPISFTPSAKLLADNPSVCDRRSVAPGPWSSLPGSGRDDADAESQGRAGNERAGELQGPVAAKKHGCFLFGSSQSKRGRLAEAARFVCKDALLMSEAAQNLDERARSDVDVFIREILRLDSRARQDVALLSSKFLKLDARAREDAEKLDLDARNKVARFRHMAMGLEEVARTELTAAAEEHWSAGALDADLRLADMRARRRAMEDTFVALEIIKNVHSALVRIVQLRETEVPSEFQMGNAAGSAVDMEEMMLDPSPLYPGSTVTERLAAIEDVYWEMAASLAKANGSDLKDPEEIEFVVAALLDMNEVDGGSGASLLAQCASSPDDATRLALADVLSGAPSLWKLGNAGMGALQRLAEDSNPAIAAAANNAIKELKQQWQQEVEDVLLFRLENENEFPEEGL